MESEESKERNESDGGEERRHTVAPRVVVAMSSPEPTTFPVMMSPGPRYLASIKDHFNKVREIGGSGK